MLDGSCKLTTTATTNMGQFLLLRYKFIGFLLVPGMLEEFSHLMTSTWMTGWMQTTIHMTFMSLGTYI